MWKKNWYNAGGRYIIVKIYIEENYKQMPIYFSLHHLENMYS